MSPSFPLQADCSLRALNLFDGHLRYLDHLCYSTISFLALSTNANTSPRSLSGTANLSKQVAPWFLKAQWCGLDREDVNLSQSSRRGTATARPPSQVLKVSRRRRRSRFFP